MTGLRGRSALREHMPRPLTDAERVLEGVRLEASFAPERLAETEAPESSVHLALATVAWMAAVCALTNVALPAAGSLVGAQWSLVAAIPAVVAWATSAVVVACALLVLRPKVPADGQRDPLLAATAGGLAVWVLASNALPVYQPFAALGWGELGWLTALNLLEMGLLGAVWASLTPRPTVAFALGAGFQLLVVGIGTAVIAF